MKTVIEVKRRIATDFAVTGRIWNLCLFSTHSLNRFLQHEGHIGAGSVEICRAEFLLDVLDVNLGMAS